MYKSHIANWVNHSNYVASLIPFITWNKIVIIKTHKLHEKTY